MRPSRGTLRWHLPPEPGGNDDGIGSAAVAPAESRTVGPFIGDFLPGNEDRDRSSGTVVEEESANELPFVVA